MIVYEIKYSACYIAGLLLLTAQDGMLAQSSPDLARQIVDLQSQGPSGKAHERFVHAKGIVCEGSFQASPGAAAVSKAAHFGGGVVPITVRFSDGAPDMNVADGSPDANPRGMAIRFRNGRGTDILAISHNGFVVGTGEDFLGLMKAQAATDTSKSHPWPIETFLESHPNALKFVQDAKPVPASFANESYYANNAFIFVNSKGQKQAGRYQIIPVGGAQYLDEATAKAKSPSFLSEELRARLSNAPARFYLLLQLAEAGDQTNDSSEVWPASRKTIELGTLTINTVVEDSAAADRDLAFDPTRLADGIELSDDPLPTLRSRVYAYSVAGRSSK